MSNKIYDFLKYVAIIFMPALTTFVGVILNNIQYEHTDIVLNIMTGLATFLGAILVKSNIDYKKVSG